jgi:ADP-ribose pyrophosphatase YjhB (NUDIX family)
VPIPEFIVNLRRHIGHEPLWLPGVTAVVLRDDAVLLVRRSDNGAWAPVSGIVDPGEHPARTAVREVQEETAVSCAVEGLAWVGVTEPVVYPNGDRAQYLDHTFRCRYVEGTARVADDESLDVGWFDLTDLPAMGSAVLERIRAAAEYTGGTRID